jgi:hypothetical protein
MRGQACFRARRGLRVGPAPLTLVSLGPLLAPCENRNEMAKADSPTMTMNYWLEGWIESNRVRSVNDAMAIVANPAGLDEIIEVATQWGESPPELYPSDETLLAGPGLDLDVRYHCGNRDCRRFEIERLLRHSVLYYADILMPDVLGDLLASSKADLVDPIQMNNIRNGFEMFFDLKTLGALPLLRFFPRSSGGETYLDACLNGSPEEQDRLSTATSEFGDFLSSGFSFNEVAPGVIGVRHSATQCGWLFGFPLDDPGTHYLSLQVGASLLGEYWPKLFETAAHVERFKVPVGYADPLYGQFERIFYQKKESAAPTFEMPSLSGVPLPRLIDLRFNNPTQIAQVRSALREASTDAQLSHPGAHLDSTVLGPALREVEALVEESAQKMRRELGLAAMVMFVTTTFTVVSNSSFLALLPSAAGAASPVISAYLERRKRLSGNPYSLLWKAMHSHEP